MRITLTILLLSVLFHFKFTSLNAQDLRYSVVWKGDSIGHVLANKYDSAEFNIYTIQSKVNFWFFGSRTIEFDYHTIYKEGSLVKANTRYIRNGRLKEQSSIILNGRGYDIISDGNYRLLTDPNPIDYSVTTIYHNEPGTSDSIFSERFGTVLKVKNAGLNHYYIEKPDGRHTEYFFEDGTCSRVIVDNFFATFTFERTD